MVTVNHVKWGTTGIQQLSLVVRRRSSGMAQMIVCLALKGVWSVMEQTMETVRGVKKEKDLSMIQLMIHVMTMSAMTTVR
ncbi:MAG: hypothetical protein QF535_18935 [Anaerolineales bacterium]|nr:hypothetical protein [Anaerolineales bacterium]